ncbi:MAG TPA: lipoyl(octanoyl) transferase [Sphaerochaeta sp.]|jgi:lipoate-protein ligase B|nr:lipoyl(octanoyl) transferase [Sphaerochaeta sp.]
MLQIQELLSGNIPLLYAFDEKPLCVDCGLMDYQKALSLQLELHEHVANEELPALLLLCEHPPVITLGLHAPHNQLLCSKEQLEAMDIHVVPTRRGGGSTAHNPGQLVLYPIMKLSAFGFRIATFVHAIEQLGMQVLKKTEVSSMRKARYPGLWVGDKKIASLGTQIKQGVSMHGIAINLYNDLTLFDYIVPCGIEGVQMTNVIREGGKHIPMEQLKDIVQSNWTSMCLRQKHSNET